MYNFIITIALKIVCCLFLYEWHVLSLGIFLITYDSIVFEYVISNMYDYFRTSKSEILAVRKQRFNVWLISAHQINNVLKQHSVDIFTVCQNLTFRSNEWSPHNPHWKFARFGSVAMGTLCLIYFNSIVDRLYLNKKIETNKYSMFIRLVHLKNLCVFWLDYNVCTVYRRSWVFNFVKTRLLGMQILNLGSLLSECTY